MTHLFILLYILRDYNLDEFERMQQTDSSDTPGVQVNC